MQGRQRSYDERLASGLGLGPEELADLPQDLGHVHARWSPFAGRPFQARKLEGSAITSSISCSRSGRAGMGVSSLSLT